MELRAITDIDLIIAQNVNEVMIADELLGKIGMKIFTSSESKILFLKNYNQDINKFKLRKNGFNQWQILDGNKAFASHTPVTVNFLEQLINRGDDVFGFDSQTNINEDESNSTPRDYNIIKDEVINEITKNYRYDTLKQIFINKDDDISKTIPCKILWRKDGHIFVTTNLEYGEELYNTGDYIMQHSYIINPPKK